jgi:hypothetical protein
MPPIRTQETAIWPRPMAGRVSESGRCPSAHHQDGGQHVMLARQMPLLKWIILVGGAPAGLAWLFEHECASAASCRTMGNEIYIAVFVVGMLSSLSAKTGIFAPSHRYLNRRTITGRAARPRRPRGALPGVIAFRESGNLKFMLVRSLFALVASRKHARCPSAMPTP